MVSERLKKTILAELGLDDFEIVDSTTAAMVPGWDSLSHVRVILAVEREFGVRFGTLEVIRLRNVGDLQGLVDRKFRVSEEPH
jgi:acyl carrier protein